MPLVIVEESEIEKLEQVIDYYISTHKNCIPWPVLVSFVHPLQYYTNEETARKFIDARYEDTGKLLNNRYELWRKKHEADH